MYTLHSIHTMWYVFVPESCSCICPFWMLMSLQRISCVHMHVTDKIGVNANLFGLWHCLGSGCLESSSFLLTSCWLFFCCPNCTFLFGVCMCCLLRLFEKEGKIRSVFVYCTYILTHKRLLNADYTWICKSNCGTFQQQRKPFFFFFVHFHYTIYKFTYAIIQKFILTHNCIPLMNWHSYFSFSLGLVTCIFFGSASITWLHNYLQNKFLYT